MLKIKFHRSLIALLSLLSVQLYAQETPPICPAWAFKPWVWEDNDNTQSTIESIVNTYLDDDIPVGAVIIDSPWSNYYNDFIWNTTQYPDALSMVSDFNDKGVKVIMWMTGFINSDSPDYDLVCDRNYTVDNNKFYTWWKDPGGVHLDFTNPAAMDWLSRKLDSVHAYGVSGWKVDGGVDYLNETLTTSIGNITLAEFKEYYYGFMYDYVTQKDENNITIARAYSFQGGVGAPIESSPISWQGDYNGVFSGIDAQKTDIYKSADLGYGAPGVEVGGFQSTVPTKRSLIRYAQFGALTPLMLNGGSNGGTAEHLPWYWDDETVEIYQYYATLHNELIPFFFSNSVKAHLTGLSIIRNADDDNAQHQLGDEIFTSILTSDNSYKQVVFPDSGYWIDYWDETKVYQPGTKTSYRLTLDKFPIFLKTGSVIPLYVSNNITGHGSAAQTDQITLLIYPSNTSTSEHYLPLGEGVDYAELSVTVDELAGTVKVQCDTIMDFHLRIKSFLKPGEVLNADNWSYDDSTRYIEVDKTGSEFTISIDTICAYYDNADIDLDDYINETDTTTSAINGVAGSTGVEVFPNPFSNQLTFNVPLDSSSPVLIMIYDNQGKVVQETLFKQVCIGNNTFSVDMDDSLDNGMYFYQLQTNNNAYNGLIVKTN